HPDKVVLALDVVLREVAGDAWIPASRFGGTAGIDPRRVHRPHYAVGHRPLQCEERRHIRRPGEIDQPSRRAGVLTERQPLTVVAALRRAIQKLVRLAFEDPEDARLLLRPGPPVQAEVLQVARERTVKRPALVALPTEGPVRIRRMNNKFQKRVPTGEPEDAV